MSQKLILNILKEGVPVKRFMEQTAGGRNPYDSILFIDGDDNARAVGDDISSKFGGVNNIYAPAVILNLPNGEKASKIYGHINSIYILSTNGNVYSIGRNDTGQAALPAGNGTADVIKPTRTGISNCIKVAHPTGHGYGQPPALLSCMFLINTGQVYSAGTNQFGQLGSGNTTNTANINPYLTLGPGNSYGNPTTTVTDVISVGSWNGSGAYETYCALLSNGTVWCVGNGGEGQMGNGTTTTTNTLWRQVQNAATSTALTNIVSIYGAGVHGGTSFYALNASGELFSWGYNGQGQLGLGNTTNATRATRVTPFGSGVIVDVYAFNSGLSSVIVKMSNGDFYACGFNGSGQLGVGDTTNRNTFTLITSLQNKNIEQVYYNGGDQGNYVFAKERGTNKIYSTGNNSFGQLGLYNTSAVNVFTEIPFNITSPIIDIIPIYTWNVGGFTFILTADGNTYFAGQSRWGYAGDPDRNISIFTKNTYQLTGG